MGPDFRILLNKARKAAQEYKQTYNEYPQTGILVKKVASVMQEFTQSGYVKTAVVRCLVIRPFNFMTLTNFFFFIYLFSPFQYLNPQKWGTPVWSIPINCWVRWNRSRLISSRSVRFLLGMEGIGDGEKHGERKDIFRETV